MTTKNEMRYYNIPTGRNVFRKCKVCKIERRTTNREEPYICEIDLRTVGRDLILYKYWWVGFGVVIGLIIGLIF